MGKIEKVKVSLSSTEEILNTLDKGSLFSNGIGKTSS
jgi:hypothetical protein